METVKNSATTEVTEKSKTYPYRSEILFLYDVFRCNPNGDPFENRPRQDPRTGRIEVTDVRLKRTTRDYILRYKHKENDNLEIFVRAIGDIALTAENRYKEIFGDLPKSGEEDTARQNLIEKCIDVRMFGALVPITGEKGKGKKDKGKDEGANKDSQKGGGIQLTGAVQFNPGQSLHAAEILEIAGTGGFASGEGKKQKTFRREFLVPYALIGFYGVINENIAKETGLTEADVDLLMEALWKGTLSLHSRSKAFHRPRLLIRFDYKDEKVCGYFLDKIELVTNNGLAETSIRSPRDYVIKLDALLEEIQSYKDSLEKVTCRVDRWLNLSPSDLKGEIEKILGNDGKTLVFEVT
ncbi:MAG: type I-B CRISPR-associated protein Cas7/Csh2 [Acidobacteria bacterium]|jgi:CRISPR-associated protein Csh2|nr:MAG: type I-B CRISPR-associated protein Cas7/Csh2 [Acidobacteriota bacterium]GIU82903.1 MAG: type I-B CRISPR-associated protein Cas7/Csh2 [Pyrinomonadaceae bacterium]